MLDKYQSLLLRILHQDSEKTCQICVQALAASDWEHFISAAIHYRIPCQVYEYLSSDPHIRTHVPVDSLERLNRAVQNQLRYNFLQYTRVRNILVACEHAKIPVILFKGLWLVEHVYRDPKARLSGDIDLLIQPENMSGFTRVATEIGCIVPEATNNLQLLAPSSNEYPLMYRNNETCVDVHWAMANPTEEAPIDELSIWQRSEATTIGGASCRTFKLEDHILYLCFHAAIHHRFVYVGPRALFDIALLIKAPPRQIDWEDFIVRAEMLDWSRGVWLILDLIHEHLGVSPPEFVMVRMQPDNPPNNDLREMVMETLFLDQVINETDLPLNLAVLKNASWTKKASILYNRLFPRSEEIATQFHVPLEHPRLAFLYLKRFQRLARHIPRILKIIPEDPEQKAAETRMLRINAWLKQ